MYPDSFIVWGPRKSPIRGDGASQLVSHPPLRMSLTFLTAKDMSVKGIDRIIKQYQKKVTQKGAGILEGEVHYGLRLRILYGLGCHQYR